MDRILLVGSTGVLGRSVLPRLVEKGYPVRALVRRVEQQRMLEGIGAEAILGDILRPETLSKAAQDCGIVLHLATALPKVGRPQDWSLNDLVLREGTRNLLAACQDCQSVRYIQQSTVLVYGERGSLRVDETQPLRPQAFVQSAADMENMVQVSAMQWSILRAGLLYGPDTWREEGWRRAAREGSLRWPGDGSACLSLIHVTDMAQAVVLAVTSPKHNGIYNVVDDEPVTYRSLYRYIAASVNAPEPVGGEEAVLPSLNCSNDRIKAELGWAPVFPTYRSGLAD